MRIVWVNVACCDDLTEIHASHAVKWALEKQNSPRTTRVRRFTGEPSLTMAKVQPDQGGGRTFGQMTKEEKGTMSHRKLALDKLAEHLLEGVAV